MEDSKSTSPVNTEWQDSVILFINGEKFEVDRPDPSTTLSEYLRDGLSLTASKVGCGQGLCGACTVMVSEIDSRTKKVTHRSVNACLYPLVHAHFKAITTLEGLGTTITSKSGIHPIQERFSMAHASQCGFCTPGMVMAFYTLLRNNPGTLTEEMIKENLDGNYCRCTGYRPILDAMRSFTEQAGQQTASPVTDDSGQVITRAIGLDGAKLHPLDLASEKIFPPFLTNREPTPLRLTGDVLQFFAPRDIKSLLEVMNKHPQAVLISGNSRKIATEAQKQLTVISLAGVAELQQIKLTEEGISIGAAASINVTREALAQYAKEQDQDKGAIFRAIDDHWRWIAGTQVRNIASIGGSVVVGHIWGGQESSDLIPLLVVTSSTVSLQAASGWQRTVPVAEFVKGGNQVDLKEGEFIQSINIPFSKPHEFVDAYKQSNRRVSSYSDVTGAVRFLLEKKDNNMIIKEAAICFGGVVAAKRAAKTEAALVGVAVHDLQNKLAALFELVKQDYPEEGRNFPLAPRQEYPTLASLEYRQTIMCGLLFKSVSRLQAKVEDTYNMFPLYHAPVTHGSQKFTPPKDGEGEVHKPLHHSTAKEQSTGEAVYGDDIEVSKLALFGAFVQSPVAHGKFLGVDTEAALAMKGVHSFWCAKDMVANISEPVFKSVTFADKELEYVGQPVGIIVANSRKRAERAAKAVKVLYEQLPAIITIKQAIEANSFYPPSPMGKAEMQKGDVDAAFKKADVIVEGEFDVGGAIHWYMEPHTTYAIPREDGGLTVTASCQGPAWVQNVIAMALGKPFKDVAVQTKRLGGGFGGKGLCFFSHVACSLAASKTGRPVRMTLDRRTDMLVMGTSPQHYFKYKAGATKDGKLVGVDIQAYSNGGAANLMPAMMLGETMHHADNAYLWPAFRAKGQVAKTNIHPTRPYRGAGVPQGVLLGEWIIDHLATKMNMAPHILREINLLKLGDETALEQKLEDTASTSSWFHCRQQSKFDERRKDVDLFNAEHHFKKRGLAIVPSKYGIMARGGEAFLKASAMVSILGDGTVLCTHGGIEMGQGLNVKLMQICATTLGVDTSQVYCPTPSSEVLPYGGMTGGSSTTELIGQAIMNACEIIKLRMQPLRDSDKMKGASWQELVQAAGHLRIDLTSTGWNAPTWDKEQKGFMYHVFGAAVAEVEIDLLTGTHVVRRVDLMQDAGKSMNPAIDLGQSEGAFIQGMGWLTLEDLKFNDQTGEMDINYDIPMADNIPHEYNVYLLPQGSNSRSIFSAKAVGEPPLCLSTVIPLALKDAIIAARRERGISSEDLVLNTPLTVEATRHLIGDVLPHLIGQRDPAPVQRNTSEKQP